MYPRSSRRVFFLSAALFALAVGWIAPAKVHATCGDGLGSLHDKTKIHDPWAKSNQSPKPMPPAPNQDKPCDGPACQRGSVPLVPAVPPVPPYLQDWSCLPVLLCLLQPAPGSLLVDACSDLPARLARVIFHPPRISSPLRFV